MPVLSKWTPAFCLAATNYWYCGIIGLGPTRLISPIKTEYNCGNSSKLVLLRNLPSVVMYSSGCSNLWVGNSGVFTFIVRIFGIKNFLPQRPTLSDQYNAGPSLLIFTSIINKQSGTPKNTKPQDAQQISINLLMKEYENKDIHLTWGYEFT